MTVCSFSLYGLKLTTLLYRVLGNLHPYLHLRAKLAGFYDIQNQIWVIWGNNIEFASPWKHK